MTALIFFLILSFLTSIKCQLNNDTAVVFVGQKSDNKSVCGLVVGNPSVYFQKFAEGNYYTDSFKSIQVESSTYRFQSISYDARTKYIVVNEINYRALEVHSLLILPQLYPKYGFYRLPLSSNIPGLAFASNFNLLYWVDAIYQYIGVVDFTTSQWTKIVIVTSGTPNSIAVHEKRRFVFWIVLANNPKIERSNLFGEERTTIVDTPLTRPVGLVIDKQSEKLFWLDGNLKSCDFDGKNIVTYIIPSSVPYTSFAVYKDIIMFASPGGHINAFKVLANNDLKNFSSVDFQNISVISTAALDSMEFVSNDTNPCKTNNCDHLCFPSNDKYYCDCSFGYSLGSDGKTCNPGTLKEGQLLVGDAAGIVYQVNPNSGFTEAILNIQPNILSDLVFRIYSNVKSIYYILGNGKTIMHYDISSKKSSVYYNSSSFNMDLVVDQNTGYLYAATVDGEIYKVTAVQTSRVIISGPKSLIRKLYFHPQTRRLFYSNCTQKSLVEIDIETNAINDTVQIGVCVKAMAFDFNSKYAYFGDTDKNVWSHDLNSPTKKLTLMANDLDCVDMTSDTDFLYIVQGSNDVIKLDKKSFKITILTQHPFREATEIFTIYIGTPNNHSDNLLSRSFGSMYLLISMLLITAHLWQLLLD